MKRLILAGAGHAHALVLRDLQRQPVSGVEIVVVSPEPLAPYSGMVPGWLAGRYGFNEIVIDFPALAAAAGARWLQGEIHALDTTQRRVMLTEGGTLGYDVLSLNVGSTLHPPVTEHARMLPLRPLAMLRSRYESWLAHWASDHRRETSSVSAVGGGAAGFEALLAVLARMRTMRPDRVVCGRMISRGASLLPDLAPAAQAAARRALERHGVTLQLESSFSAQVDHDSDVVLWATGAESHDWQRDAQRRGALAVDDQGFIRIQADLRSVSDPRVFASGDCARWPGEGLPKAGVHAVRMGPVLAANLRATLSEQTNAGALKVHHAQRQFLVLLSSGDGRAIAARGSFGAEGAWAWRWKDWIDRRFVRQFQHAPASQSTGDAGLKG